MTEIQHSRRQEHQKSQKSGISNTTCRCTLLTHPPSAFTALATTAFEYMGCYGPAEAEHHVAFSWRDICRRSHMGAQLNPTSIALVAALDYPSATKMDVA